MKLAWLGEDLFLSEREFQKLQALRIKKLNTTDFFKVESEHLALDCGAKCSEQIH